MAVDDDRVRASDAERDAAIARLRDAAGEGRLTFEELADRVQDAGTATTRGELAVLTADLPAPGTTAVAATTVAGANAVIGDVRVEGRWVVPARGRWRSVLGDVVLDLREATVPPGEVVVEARSVFGDLDVLVPEGVAVEVRARTLLGDVRQKAGLDAPPGAPRVVLVGGTVLGDVRVRAQRLRERIAARLRG